MKLVEQLIAALFNRKNRMVNLKKNIVILFAIVFTGSILSHTFVRAGLHP